MDEYQLNVAAGQLDLLEWGTTTALSIKIATELVVACNRIYEEELNRARQDRRAGSSSMLRNAQTNLYNAQQQLRGAMEAAHGAKSSEARMGQRALNSISSVDKPR